MCKMEGLLVRLKFDEGKAFGAAPQFSRRAPEAPAVVFVFCLKSAAGLPTCYCQKLA